MSKGAEVMYIAFQMLELVLDKSSLEKISSHGSEWHREGCRSSAFLSDLGESYPVSPPEGSGRDMQHYPWPHYKRCELGHEAHRRGGSGGFTAGFLVLLSLAQTVYGGFSAEQPEAGTSEFPSKHPACEARA